MLRAIWHVGFLLVRFLRFGLRLVVPLLLVASLAFNAALFTVQGFYTVAAGALNAIGVTTAATREAGEKLARRKATRSIGHKTAEKVTRRVQRGAVRNIASAAGEAIPLVGIAVIAGALAMEVHDACDTASDMAGLEAALAAETDPEAARKSAAEAFDCPAMIREQLPDFEDLPSKEVLWAMIEESPAAAWDAARSYYSELPAVPFTGMALSFYQSVLAYGSSMLERLGWSEEE